MAYGDKPYGLRAISLLSLGVTPAPVTLPAAQKMKVTPRITSGELKGDDALKSAVAMVEAAEWELEAGGITLTAYAKLTGKTVTTSGSTPNEVSTFKLAAGDPMPYITIFGKSLGDGTDDIHIKLWKAKVTELEGEFIEDKFYITKCKGLAVDDGTNGIVSFVQNETATALPATRV
jgi:hypothetical protein